MLALFLPLGFLVAASLVMLSSISIHLFFLQLIWMSLGVIIIAVFLFFDWRAFLNHRSLIIALYILAALLLVTVLLVGPVIRNIRGWIKIGPFTYQPVELAKIALILVYAQYFSRRHVGIAQWQNILPSFLFFAVPAALTMLQPDLGSVIVLFGIWFGFLILGGLPAKRLAVAIGVFAVAGVFLWFFGLQPYQKARITALFYPQRDILGINYSHNQAKIAIGSAGFWGKGYGQGSQTQLGFLSEPSEDFILAAFVEEWGWLGGFLVIAAFLALVARILVIGAVADRNFEKFICLGAAMTFGLQFLINAGSTTGLLPVIGVTFPFLSYGGSSLLTNFFLLAIVNAIHLRS